MIIRNIWIKIILYNFFFLFDLSDIKTTKTLQNPEKNQRILRNVWAKDFVQRY